MGDLMKCMMAFIASMLVPLGMYGQGQRSTAPTPPIEPIRPVLNILSDSKAYGSIEFYGKCKDFYYPGFPDFPPMIADSPTIGSPVERLRSIFSGDPSMRINQASDGSIEMIEDNIPQDILDVKISDINFHGAAGIYNANAAVNVVLYSPEVQNFVSLNSISFPYATNMISLLPGPPNPRLPHISSSFHNVTVRFLLNQIAKRFQNLWIYENCPTSAKGSRVVYIRFYQP